MVAASCLFEGKKDMSLDIEKNTMAIAKKHGGLNAGEENGLKGY